MKFEGGLEIKKLDSVESIKAEIKVLEKRLALLEEIEKQPKMTLENEGEVSIVWYNDKVYYRLNYKDGYSWYKKFDTVDQLYLIEDGETLRLLEGIYYNDIQVKKEKKLNVGETLYGLIEEWWTDVFTNSKEMEVCIDDLVNSISKWLPKEQSATGSQNVYVECAVDGYNDCLNDIKRKLK